MHVEEKIWQKACLHFSYKNILLKHLWNGHQKVDIDRSTPYIAATYVSFHSRGLAERGQEEEEENE